MASISMESLGSSEDDEPTLNTTQGVHILKSVQTNQEVLNCDEEIKPKVGQLFDSLEDGEIFYKKYAHTVGFSVRCSSENKNKDGVVRWKYFVCSKEGYNPNVSKDKEVTESGVKLKRRSLTREGCEAKVAFKLLEGGKYELTRFQESHTHVLASPKKRQFLRSARKVNHIHKSIMYANSRANIGPSKTYHLLKEQLGGYENIGCTQRDLQNCFRDLKTLIKDSDAYVFIDNFKRKQEMNPSFYFAYEVDVEDRLKYVFWADGICRKNYSLFGDVMSFDTTYETNRFCMWHIMKKVSEKVGVSLNSNDDFNNKFKSCVWGSDTPDKFEATWKSIMIEFGLEKNEWLSHMYNIRNMWIPAYFRDIFLGGILRTTSRSESENSFYGNFLNPTIGLVEFWMRFESAIEAQRHKELLADNTSLHSLPILKLNRGLERHGRDIYTRENFYIFQNELWIGCIDCGVENINQKDGVDVLHIVDNSETNGKVSESFIGFDIPKEVKIHPPQISKTKGSGKRIKGGKEKAIEQQQKRSRLCKACGQYAYHDTRNCPTKSSA
ncbi:protein FAR1-RELATED SEQUENCE 5-like [Vicia villosa]|uniref:protein FAR1-RELATED SEQUENCE 5-like n=1 Tax=Vicia villosa TaxID=3911 RepID=UPI00273B10BB|nr:protein FAR1-RELATED SEQUENCE 5-like [Vicia villosa]XP_058769205.1 protein FAR1-RELATED SEQUENCE 5-like [Vicia villosa]XP_058769297.1 protein FAR1-RELATED SEQUENCE 5-like [Vicia villosa]